MSINIKSWVFKRLRRIDGLVARLDLPSREPGFESRSATPAPTGNDPLPANLDPSLSTVEHLGAYGALVAAIRDELEHFVASQVRLHLAIADRDRYLLTSIEVRSAGGPDARELLHRFMGEFKPEQVKRYLARDVIGGLANAAAIDLSQFAGLFDAEARDVIDDAGPDGEYRELLEALRDAPAPTATRTYQVAVVGRWHEPDLAPPGGPRANADATAATPLVGQRCEFDIEDADGRRRVVLQAVVRGRRYLVGKGEGCDIRVNGSYASRRHAELWLDRNGWWAIDAGSTNGIRVESRSGVRDQAVPPGAVTSIEPPLMLTEGARLVLSARAEGSPAEYPWIALRRGDDAPARITPIAAATGSPRTPLTAIRPALAHGDTLKITAFQIAGVRTLELSASALPVAVGRSRNQTLMVDRRHEAVSGHHLDIIELDASGVQVVIHGDNGVLVDGVAYPAGAHLYWEVGATMVLGEASSEHPACTLTLTRRGQGPT